MKRSLRLRLTSALTALALGGGVSVTAAAPPAKADVIATIGTIKAIIDTVKQGYDMYNQYILDNKPPSELDQIRALIQNQTSTIVDEIDALATGDVEKTCTGALNDFESITTDTPTQLDFLHQESQSCVLGAKSAIENVTTAQDIDAVGFSLAAGAPVALISAAADNQATDGLTAEIITAWRELVANTHLRPTCMFSPDVDVEQTTDARVQAHSQGGQADIPGHGACYAYNGAKPQVVEGGVSVLPTFTTPGLGLGQLPWQVEGIGQEVFCSGLDLCHHAMVTWPTTTNYDFSIAVDEAMATTSYPIAQASLNAILPSAQPTAQPVAVASADNLSTSNQSEVFGVQADGTMLRGVLDKDTGSPHQETFEGWNAFPGPAFAVKSISATANWDGRIQVFALDRIGQLYTTFELKPNDDTTWSPWAHLDLPGLDPTTQFTSVSATRTQGGSLALFATTATGDVVTRTQIPNGDSAWNNGSMLPAVSAWTNWLSLATGFPALQVSAASLTNEVGVFVVNSYGGIEERHQTGSTYSEPAASGLATWSGWAGVNAPSGSLEIRSVQAMHDGGDGGIKLLAMANGSQLFQQDWGQTVWAALGNPGSMYSGFAAAKQNIGVGWDEMVGVDLNGNVYSSSSNGALTPWTPWVPIAGATLRPYTGGKYGSPVLSQPTVSGGHVALSWTDESSNEDNFVVWRMKADGTVVSEASDQTSANKAGFGETNAFTDTAPDPSAPCYAISAYDIVGSFERSSDYLCTNPSTVPNVVGMTQDAAQTAIQNANLAVGWSFITSPQGDCQIPTNGTVMSTSPPATATENPGTVVTLSVCSLPVTSVPNVYLMQETPALQALVQAHLTGGSFNFVTDSHPIGTVIGQSVQAGTTQLQFTVVNLTVSSGPAPTVVPDPVWNEVITPLINGSSNTMCVDNSNTSSSGALSLLWHCHASGSSGTTAQRWQFVNVGANWSNGRAMFTLRNTGSNLCLTIAGSSAGSRVMQSDCGPWWENEWQILDSSTGFVGGPAQFELYNPGTGYCLTAANSSDSNGTTVVLGGCGAGNQLNTLTLG